ncbi:30S ribosomal protein S18 [Candidatus Berkelbacteria bacterium]|nr:30S ribosomal protein S18 [Candidatus Berkelbacteria bacterium]
MATQTAVQTTRKTCFFCKRPQDDIDFREVAVLEKYLSGWGKIKSARETGTCARHQRKLSHAIKASRQMALIPYTRR